MSARNASDHTPLPAAGGDRRLTVVAVAAGVAALALGGLAWLANAEAIFVDFVNAALAMCM